MYSEEALLLLEFEIWPDDNKHKGFYLYLLCLSVRMSHKSEGATMQQRAGKQRSIQETPADVCFESAGEVNMRAY